MKVFVVSINKTTTHLAPINIASADDSGFVPFVIYGTFLVSLLFILVFITVTYKAK